MINKLLYTYALAKSLYEQKEDYIDTFWPFVLKVLSRDESSLELVVQRNVKENFGLDIPQHTLKSIITRAKKKDYITVEKQQIRLTEKGTKYLDHLEPESDVNREINGLLEDIKNYLNEQIQVSLHIDEVRFIFSSFIYENIDLLVGFFNPGTEIKLHVSRKRTRKYGGEIARYFEVAEKQKPAFYKTLQDIVYGSVISAAASAPNIADVNKKFRGAQIFLDSNFVFSLFGFDFPEINKPAKELFELLKRNKFEIKVFDFTINEIVSVLSNYSREQYMYVRGVRVDSIFSNLKTRGMTTEDVREFIQKIEEKLWDLEIKIEPTDIELKNYKPEKEEYLNGILSYKPLQSEWGRKHDLAAIEKIKEIRNFSPREIERSKALFLTSDLRLSNFDYLGLGHRVNKTIPEVISDRLLTNILWLKNPTIVKTIPLTSIIAIHSRKTFINREIWKRFHENLTKLKEEGNINGKDISMLFYNHHIDSVLLGWDELDVDKITPTLILEERDKMAKTINIEIQRKLEQQKKIFEERRTTQDIKNQKEWDAKLGKIKRNINIASKKRAKNTELGIFLVIAMAIIGIMILLKFSTKILGVITSVCIILEFLGIKFDIWRIKSRLHSKLFNLFYKRRLKELELNE